jgi:hypothetical protein
MVSRDAGGRLGSHTGERLSHGGTDPGERAPVQLDGPREWRPVGGQAILTFRALCQSDRFERAWALLAATYKRPVELPRKVIALSGRRERV